MSVGKEAARIYEGILRIFRCRGYTGIERKKNGVVFAIDPRTQTGVVAYARPNKVTIASARSLLEDHQSELVYKRFLLICASASLAAVKLLSAGPYFELWAINDVICDKAAHQYCPTYTILS